MIFTINNVGEFGIIKDRKPHELPPNAWSAGENIKFYDGSARKVNGYASVFDTPANAAYGLLPVPGVTSYQWLEMGLTKVYAWDGTSHTNITRQTASVDVNYTGDAEDVWTGCLLGGVPVINNGVDLPQMWLPATTGTKLTALTNWPATTYCASMRNYKQFLVASNITKPGGSYPTTLKWSHPADPGTVPVSWNEADATKDAGEYTFSESGDFLVDTVQLRDTNIVYKENSVWGQQYIGGVDIFRFNRLFGSFGALSQNCAVEFLTGKHLVLTLGDVIVHDGQSADSILTGKWRTWLEQNLNSQAVKHCFVVSHAIQDEVWICICTGANILADTALIWNWRTGSFGIRTLPLVSTIVPGIITLNSSTEPWSTDSMSWASDTTSWGARLYNAAAPALLGAVPATPALHKFDINTDANGVAQTVVLERTGLSVPFKQKLLPDFTAMKFLRNVWPRIEGTIGGIVNVEVGTQQEIGGNVVWQSAKPYIIGTTKKIDCLASGRLFGLRFSSNTALEWVLHGYELDIDFAGNF